MKTLTQSDLKYVVGGNSAPPVVGGGSVTYTDPNTGISVTGGGSSNSDGGAQGNVQVTIPWGNGQTSGGGLSGNLGAGNESQNAPAEPTTGVDGPYGAPSDADRNGVDAYGRPLQPSRS